MSTIDEILASGRYTDRLGRRWSSRPSWTTPDGRGVWSHAARLAKVPGGAMFNILDPAQMRLLIERDQHRDVCVGIKRCEDHPVHFVQIYHRFPTTRFVVYGPREWDDEKAYFHTLAEAMNAARALAVRDV